MAAIRSVGNGLGMATMMFHDEVVPTRDVEQHLPAETKLTEKELFMARHLIQALATDFEPTKYENLYYRYVMEMKYSPLCPVTSTRFLGVP